VPNAGRIYEVETYFTEPVVATVAEPQGGSREVTLKEAEGKPSTERTASGYEAGRGRQVGWDRRSPKTTKTRQVEPIGTKGKILHLTWGSLPGESRGEVSRGHSS
jgi:hypothetical protein